MKGRQLSSGTAGVVAAAIIGLLQTVLLVFLPTAVVHSICLPVLAVRYGLVSALVSEMTALIGVGFVWGREMTAVFLLLTLVPGMLGIWLSQRPGPLFWKATFLLLAQLFSAILVLGVIRYIGGVDVADHLSAMLAGRITGNGGDAILYFGGLTGWFSSDTMIRIGEYGGTAEQIARRLSEDLRIMLPANVFTASVLTALGAAWCPVHVLERHGLTEKGEYVPVEKWWFPLRFLFWPVFFMIVLPLARSVDANSVMQLCYALIGLLLGIMGAAEMSGSLKYRGMGFRSRMIWITVIALLVPVVLRILGLWRILFGAHGLLMIRVKKRRIIRTGAEGQFRKHNQTPRDNGMDENDENHENDDDPDDDTDYQDNDCDNNGDNDSDNDERRE